MRKPVPGFRFFECEDEDCDFKWRVATRDCESPSGAHCEACGDFCYPVDCEPHLEWKTDENGNMFVPWDG